MGSLGVCLLGQEQSQFLDCCSGVESRQALVVLWDVLGGAGLSVSLLLRLFSASGLAGRVEHPPKHQATLSSENKHFIQTMCLCFCLPRGHFAIG